MAGAALLEHREHHPADQAVEFKLAGPILGERRNQRVECGRVVEGPDGAAHGVDRLAERGRGLCDLERVSPLRA